LVLASISAQDKTSFSIGAVGGFCFSSVRVNTDDKQYFKYKPGYNASGLFEISLENNIIIQTQFGLIQLGHLYKVHENLVTMDTTPNLTVFEKSSIGHEMIVERSYLLNTWLVGYSFGQRFIIKPQIGFYWGVHMKSSSQTKFFINVDPDDHIQIGDPSLPIGYHDTIYYRDYDSKEIPKYDAGLHANLSLEYSLNNVYRIFISTGYYIGLVSVLDENNERPMWVTRAITLNVGFSVRL
jgi:hypothetical protein